MHETEWNLIADDINFTLEIDITQLRSLVPVEDKILDFGCGYGRISSQLHKCGYSKVVGVDSSMSMIERGKREHPELALEHIPDGVLPFSDDSFDAIVSCAVFTCITDHKNRLTQINELFRILKPGGVFHMVEFCAEPSRFFTASIGVPMRHSSPHELRELISSFSVTFEETVETHTMGGSPARSYCLFARKPLKE